MKKKLFLLCVLVMMLQTTFYGQITKSEIQTMLTETGVTLDSLKRVYLANSLIFNNDGTSQRMEIYYEKNPSDGTNVFAFTETGLKISYYTAGKNTVAHFFPYDNIAVFDLYQDYLRISLKY